MQTVVAATLNWTRDTPSTTQRIGLADGHQLAVEVSTPESWQPPSRTVVLMHGLCGCHGSPYLVRMARKLVQRGIRAVRVNMRGCGSGKDLARKPYHSGRSDDLLAVLSHLRSEHSGSPTIVIGFSLGGNVALKLAGELRAEAPRYLDKVIAVCPPVHLAECARLLSLGKNRIYERNFVRLLRKAVRERRAQFPDLPTTDPPRRLSLREFDEFYTAPHCGFENARDYYEKCSAAPLLPRIEVPSLLLFAEDDPFIDSRTLDGISLPTHVRVVRTARGGHLGFLGTPGWRGGYRWLDTQLLEWLEGDTRD